MKKISAIIVALVTVLIVFALIGSIVFVYPTVAGQQLTIPSGSNGVHYEQGGKQYIFGWVSQNSPEYLSIAGLMSVYPVNFAPTTYYPGTEEYGGSDFLTPTHGATYDLSGFGLIITIISGGGGAADLVISVRPTSFWQTTIIIYLTVIAILLAVIIVLLLLRRRKTANLSMSRISKRKIVAIVFIVAVLAVVAYEFSVANSLSGYTKISLILRNQPYSVKFGAAQYNITLQPMGYYGPLVAFQVSTDNNLTKVFVPSQGDKYSFSGLQIVVGSLNNEQVTLTLYVKSATSKSKPIVSSPKINIAINFSSNTVSRIWNGSGYDYPKSGYTYAIVNISISNYGYEGFDTNATYFTAIAINGVSYNYDPETSVIYWSTTTVDNYGIYFGRLVFQIPVGTTIQSMSYSGTTSTFQKYNIVWNGQTSTT